jgi:hypothetical protein
MRYINHLYFFEFMNIVVNSRIIHIHTATVVSDKALDDKYGYGTSETGTFGYQANMHSSMYALKAIKEYIKVGGNNFSTENKILIEIVAEAVHDGWSNCVRNVFDARYLTETGETKLRNRLELADTHYNSLSEEEKEKDRVIARAMIELISKTE